MKLSWTLFPSRRRQLQGRVGQMAGQSSDRAISQGSAKALVRSVPFTYQSGEENPTAGRLDLPQSLQDFRLQPCSGAWFLTEDNGRQRLRVSTGVPGSGTCFQVGAPGNRGLAHWQKEGVGQQSHVQCLVLAGGLSCLERVPYTERLQVRFLVRAHT